MHRPPWLPWELLHCSDFVLQFFPSLQLGERLPVCLFVHSPRLTMLPDTGLEITRSQASHMANASSFPEPNNPNPVTAHGPPDSGYCRLPGCREACPQLQGDLV